MQLSLGLPDPRDQSSLPILRRVQAGISRARLGTTSARVRLPITPPLLRQICRCLEATMHSERVVLWAICSLAFFGCFRLGELLLESSPSFDRRRHLAWGDIAVDNQANPRMLRIHLKQSKTDQFGRGADVVVGRTGRDLCPVAAVLGYIAIRGSQPGPFFLNPRGQPITKAHFVGEVRIIIGSLGFPQEQFAGHSFRIGAATSAALAGMEDSSIQLLGRWSSAAFLRYIRTPPEKLAALSGILISTVLSNRRSREEPMQQDAIGSSQDSSILQCCLILSKWPVLMFEMKNHHCLPCAGAVVQFPGNGEEYITYTLGGHDHLRWPLTLGEDAPLKRGQLSCTPPKMYHVTKGVYPCDDQASRDRMWPGCRP